MSTWGDDEGQARDRSRLGDFARCRFRFFWGLQLVSNASGCPSSEGRPGACAVAPDSNTLQVGDYPIYYQGEQSVKH